MNKEINEILLRRERVLARLGRYAHHTGMSWLRYGQLADKLFRKARLAILERNKKC